MCLCVECPTRLCPVRTLATMFRLTAVTTVLLLLGAAGCSDQEPEKAEPAAGAARESPSATARQTPSKPAPKAPSTAPPETLAPSQVPEVLADAVENGPTRPRNAAQVAAQIMAAETAIADPATEPEVLAAAGHVQQLAYRVLGKHPEWDARVRAAVHPGLRSVVTDNVRSRREFRAMHRRLSDTLPAWRIVRPAPAEQLRSHYQQAERRFGVDWEYLAAINLVETGMGRIRGTSVAGAQGPMQFIPSTWEAYGRGDINSPRDSIMAAARYLRAQGFNRPGGIARALYRYNNSNRYVRGVTHLAKVMERRPRAFFGYYHWEIYYLSKHGDVLLPVGYEALDPIPVKRWLAANPQA